MTQGILRTNDINPDGIRIAINWDAFVVGASIFVPCINTKLAVRQLEVITNDNDFKCCSVVRVENNKMGVRLWRMV
jgi:hypothetical protein